MARAIPRPTESSAADCYKVKHMIHVVNVQSEPKFFFNWIAVHVSIVKQDVSAQETCLQFAQQGAQ